MKNVIVLLIAVVSFAALASNRVENFEELMTSLKEGKSVQTVIYYEKCQLISGNKIKDKSPNAVGGMPIETYEYFSPMMFGNKNGFIATSESKMIMNPLGGGYVYNYVKMKILDNNKVEIIAQYVDAQTFEVRMNETFYTEIFDGEDESKGFHVFTE